MSTSSAATDLRDLSKTVEPTKIDWHQLRTLLRCYFQLSIRGNITRTIGRKKGSPSGAFLRVSALYAVMGMILAINAFRLDVFAYCLLAHAMTFFTIGMAIASESGEILFSVHEADVFLHRPIAPRTLLTAKLLNLMAFASILGGSLNLLPTLAIPWTKGASTWTPLVYILSTFALCMFCCAVVVISYGLVTKLFGRERFDAFATWSQIGMSLLFMVGYQMMPTMLRHLEGQEPESLGWSLLLLPFGWFACLDVVLLGIGGNVFLLASLLAVLMPLLLCYLAITKLAGSYTESLTGLRDTSTKPRSRPVLAATRPVLLRGWLRDPMEWCAFRLTAAYMRRDRELKLRLYPSLASFFLFPMLTLVQHSPWFAVMSYAMFGMLPIAALESIRFSGHHAAAEVFDAAPLASAAPLFHGARKAILYYLLLPMFVLTTALYVVVFPNETTLMLALPLILLIPTLSLLPAVFSQYIPLARPFTSGEQSGRMFLLSMTAMIIPASFLGLFWIVREAGYFVPALGVEIVTLAAIHWSLLRIIRQRAYQRLGDV